MSQTYCVVDIEATGGNHRSGRIIEVGIVKVQDAKVISEYSVLINPLQTMDKYVSKLTGITDLDLKDAPEFNETAEEMLDFLGDSVFVAHNATFDYTYLRTEFRRAGIDYNANQLCTLDISRKLFPEEESYSLGKLSRSLGIQVEDRHRALGDAAATARLFIKCLQEPEGADAVEEFMREKALGSEEVVGQVAITDNLSANLPDEPGVFLFKSKKKKVLYVGRGDSIKNATQKLLSGSRKYERFTQHINDIESVEFELTGNELLAELLFYQRVFKLRPLLNIHLKQLEYRYVIGVIKRKDKAKLAISRVRDRAGVVLSYFKDYKSAEKQLRLLIERHDVPADCYLEGLQTFNRIKKEDIKLNGKWAKEAPFNSLLREKRRSMPNGWFRGAGIKVNENVVFRIDKGRFIGYAKVMEEELMAQLSNGLANELHTIEVNGLEKVCWHYLRETNQYVKIKP